MIKSAATILIALSIFLSMVTNMALKKEDHGYSIWFAMIGAIGGTICYGLGYAVTDSTVPVAVFRTVLAVCGMFVGRWEVTNVESIYPVSCPPVLCFFLIFHFLAFYSLANAVMMKLGSSLLRQFRIRLLKKNDLNIIYGVTDQTILFANRKRDDPDGKGKSSSILFVPDTEDSHPEQLTDANGWACRSDPDALAPNRRFLKSLGIRSGNSNRRITLYALSSAENRNRRYASAFLDILKTERIPSENLSLTIYTDDIANIDKMISYNQNYGYRDVNSFELQSLTARLMMLEYPVYDRIRFNPDGTAAEDVEIFIAGFGSTGQAVLRSFYRNGQFEGSHFHAAVFASDIDSLAGRFFSVYEEMCSAGNIDFNCRDARSTEAAGYVKEHAGKLKYIVACTGDDKTDWEIVRSLEAVLDDASGNILFLICGKGTVTKVGTGTAPDVTSDIWRDDILTASVADRTAKAVNASYSGCGGDDPEELWRTCPPFSRESCRAAADFTRAYCRMAGISEKDAAAGKWDVDGELLENMSKTEHLRWNAFHRSMGWQVMRDSEFQERAKTYLSNRLNGLADIRIAKNETAKRHACLVTWEELSTLSDKENAVTGGNVDYQQYDRDNVLAVPALLRAFGL